MASLGYVLNNSKCHVLMVAVDRRNMQDEEFTCLLTVCFVCAISCFW